MGKTDRLVGGGFCFYVTNSLGGEVTLFFLKKTKPRRGIVPYILNLITWWWWVVNITLRPLYPSGNRPGTHCVGDWVWPKAGLDGLGKCPNRDSNPTSSSPQPSRHTTELPQLLHTVSCRRKVALSNMMAPVSLFTHSFGLSSTTQIHPLPAAHNSTPPPPTQALTLHKNTANFLYTRICAQNSYVFKNTQNLHTMGIQNRGVNHRPRTAPRLKKEKSYIPTPYMCLLGTLQGKLYCLFEHPVVINTNTEQ